MIERQQYKFTCLLDGSGSPSRDEYDDSCMGSDSKQARNFFRVKEEEKEDDEEEEEGDNLSQINNSPDFDDNDYASARGDDGQDDEEGYENASDMNEGSSKGENSSK